MPCSKRNSAVWDSGGSFSPMVCSITLGPAKPISAFGSAIMASPREEKLAAIPPVVGFTWTHI